ncbi:MAG TPA: sugar transferase [Candidatus Polarisedimenticolaceae bacterium]|nr:sugar transferase [Candidatus Polarisedimenticolaceae bacterium]
MISQRARQASYLLGLVDAMLLVLALLLAFAVRSLIPFPWLRDGLGMDLPVHTWLLTLGIPIYWLLAYGHKLYDPTSLRGKASTTAALLWVFGYLTAILGLAIFIFQVKAYSRAIFFLFLGLGFLLVTATRIAILWFGKHTGRDAADIRNVVIVGTGPEALEMRAKLEAHNELGMRVVGHLPGPFPAPMSVEPEEVVGKLSDLKQILSERVVDDVVFGIPVVEALSCEREIAWCEEVGVTVHLRADLVRTLFARMYPTDLDGTPMLTVSATPRQPAALLLKRTTDLVTSVAALAVLSPVFLVTAILVRLTSPGTIFFRQTRVGLNGRKFTLYKFRSMYRDAETRKAALEHRNEMTGPVFKIKDDPRITPVGKWIRRFSIDEIPQFWNVLKGDMSLVGPRPPIPEEVKKYERWQRRRLSMKPGITCLWQVSGRNGVDFENWMRLDLAYIDTWSLRLDVQILLRTVPVVLTARGAH